LTGLVNGRRVWVGKPELLPQQGPGANGLEVKQVVEARRTAGETVGALTVDDAPGLLAFRDELRPGAADCIARLRHQGVHRIEMLTGDHELVARAVSRRLGLDGFRAELLPDQKLEVIAALRPKDGGRLVMVGDGVNDAPALAHADVGIAMGGIGSDVALDAAHIVLMNDRIETLAWLDRLAKRTAAIVRENLVLAIGVIAVLSVFAVAGRVPLPLAVVGHEGSTVLVALNALRLLRTAQV
jgi:Cd2+/Zn2+-exporting ATPase